MLIKNQKIEIKITKRIEQWYKNKGYDTTNKTITVNAEDLSPGAKYKVNVICDYCGQTIQIAWRDYYRRINDNKYACVHCKMKKVSENTAVCRRNDLYNRALSVCQEKGYELITKLEDVHNSETRVIYLCPKHGLHETKIYTLICGHGCVDCQYENNAQRARNTIEDIINVGKKHNIVILNPEDYINWETKNLRCICRQCGNEYVASYGALSHNKTLYCGECMCSESIGEKTIRSYLEFRQINFEQEYRFDDCKDIKPLPFDFYLSDYNVCIEYQGRQHYEVVNKFGGEDAFAYRKKHDLIKKEYCFNNNIELLEIPYWEFDNINKILDKRFTQRHSLIS